MKSTHSLRRGRPQGPNTALGHSPTRCQFNESSGPTTDTETTHATGPRTTVFRIPIVLVPSLLALCQAAFGRYSFSVPVIIELPPREDQLAFNRECWRRVCANPTYANRSEKIETNRFGEIVMSPPPFKPHGRRQYRIASLIDRLLPGGFVTSESPVSTADGVKGADVTWASREREAANPDDLYETAPEICVEVRSPANTDAQLTEKRTLYFDAGAEEVWICDADGTMRFFTKAQPDNPAPQSKICPNFPPSVPLD